MLTPIVTWLVVVNNSHCGLCKLYQTVWTNVAKELVNDTTIKVAELNVYFSLFTYRDNYPDFTDTFDIDIYPSIYLFRNDQYEVYTGSKLAKPVIEFARKKERNWSIIPPTKQYWEKMIADIKKNAEPYLLLPDRFGLEFLPWTGKVAIVLVLTFLPVILVFVCYLCCGRKHFEEEKECKECIEGYTREENKESDTGSCEECVKDKSD